MEDNKKPTNAPNDSSSAEILDAELDDKETVLTKIEDDSKVKDNEDLSGEELEYLKTLRELSNGDLDSLTTGNKNLKEMSKAQAKALRKAENKIVTERGVELRADTERSKLNDDFDEFRQSFKVNKILRGTIVSAKVDSENAQYYANVSFGHDMFNVLIPSYALFVHNSSNIRNDEGTQQQVEKRITSMIGAEVEFVCYHVDKNKRFVIGDRLKALEILGRINYINIPKGEESPRVIPGIIAEAKIIAVSRNSVTVNTLGSDCTLRSDNLTDGYNEVSWGRPADLHNEFTVGDTTLVKVLNIDRVPVQMNAKRYQLIKTEVSIRQAQMDPMEKYYNEIQENMKILADITSVTESGVFVNLKGYGIPALCAFPKFGATPKVGNKRVVQITGKDITEDGRKRIYGIFART